MYGLAARPNFSSRTEEERLSSPAPSHENEKLGLAARLGSMPSAQAECECIATT